MKACENHAVHRRFHGIPGATVGRGIQIHDGRSDGVFEPVAELETGRILQQFPNNPIGFSITGGCDLLDRQVDVDRRAGSFETKLQRITTLQSPRSLFDPE